ncbi:MAG: hypothetical protein WC915_03585 [archaeon]
MYKQILILMVIILSLTASFALAINSPSTVYVNDKEVYFIVEVVNESNTGQNLEVNYFAPVPTQVIAPGYIAPNSKTTVKIFVKNDVIIPVDISTTLEVKTDKYLSKEILLKFNQQENTNQNNPQIIIVTQDSDIANNATGVFTLSLIQGVEQISTESILLFLLILVIIVLLVVFIVRLAKRV